MAHVHGRPDNQQEHLDDILGRGPGDPDMYGYPGENETARQKPKNVTPSVYRKKHWSKTSMRNSSTIFKAPRDFGDNDASSPEQAGY